MRPATRTTDSVPPLRAGQRLTQKEFHRRYELHPEDAKFELIGGVVHMASPLNRQHGTAHVDLGTALSIYKAATPGTSVADNTTTILGDRSEPQPDLSLLILPEYGGQSRVTEDDYLTGPPELIAEVSLSSEADGLGARRRDYEQAGVLEYLVVALREQSVRWFDFRAGAELRPRRGVYRSRAFPGLWLDAPALFANDTARLILTVQQGLATPGHSRFIARLARAHRRLSGGTPS